MAKVSEVADNIYQIHPELESMFSLSYLVLGEESALIEPGSTTQVDIVLRAMEEELKFDPTSLSYIIPTHLHMDHGGGVGYMAQKLAQARVVVYERAARHLVDPTKLIEATQKAFGQNFADEFGPILPVPENQLFQVHGGDKIDLGSRDLEIIYSPGHATHHICIYDDKSQGLFCGDALGMYFPDDEAVAVICPEGFDLDAALKTINQLRGLAPKLLFYSHEGIGQDAGKLMQQAEEELRDCGDIVLEALRAGEDSEQIAQRLEGYFTSGGSTKLNCERMYLDLTVAGYRGYFKKLGLI